MSEASLHSLGVERPAGGAAWPGLTLLYGVTLAIAAYLAAVPLVILIISSVNASGSHLPFETGVVTLANYAKVLGDPSTYRLLANSAVFAGGATVLGIVIAVFFAFIIERTDIAGRRFLFVVILIPMAIPNMIYATSWMQLCRSADGADRGHVPKARAAVSAPYHPVARRHDLHSGHRARLARLSAGGGVVPNVDPTWEEQSTIAGKGKFLTLWAARRRRAPGFCRVVIFFSWSASRPSTFRAWSG